MTTTLKKTSVPSKRVPQKVLPTKSRVLKGRKTLPSFQEKTAPKSRQEEDDEIRQIADEFDSGESEEENLAEEMEQDTVMEEEEEMEGKTNHTKKSEFASLKDIIPLHSSKKRNQAHDDSASRAVYLGRIPHGFFEDQMRSFFSQFGVVTKLRLSRNKKTAKSKHYAFIEFEDPEVAKIVVDSMHGYHLFGHSLVCKLIPKDKIHPELFKGANRVFKKIPWRKIARAQHNKPKEPAQMEKLAKRLLLKEEKKRKQLQELGISYDFPGYAAEVQGKAKHTKFD